MISKAYPWKRYLLANRRDVRVLVRQFYIPLLNVGEMTINASQGL